MFSISITYRNLSGSGGKKSVSFNKKLYIRYRTTSEESSNSTLKVRKKHKLKDHHTTPLKRFSKKDESDHQFDQLKNKCSWSYRSQKVKHRSKNMETNAESEVENPYQVEALQNNSDTAENNGLFGKTNDSPLHVLDNSDLRNNALGTMSTSKHKPRNKFETQISIFSKKSKFNNNAEDSFAESTLNSITSPDQIKDYEKERKISRYANVTETPLSESVSNLTTESDPNNVQNDGYKKERKKLSYEIDMEIPHTETISNLTSASGTNNVQSKDKKRRKHSTYQIDIETAFAESILNSITESDTNNIKKVYEKAESCNSSTDEEVLQTRLSVQNKHLTEKEYDSDDCLFSPENIPRKGSIPENDSTTKKISPIIIQATAYENKSSNFGRKINHENEKHKNSETIFSSVSSLSGEENNSNEAECSFMKESIDNIDCSNPGSRKNKNEILQKSLLKTSFNKNSSALQSKELNNTSTDTLLQEFLDGSFDIRTYLPDTSSERKKPEKDKHSLDKTQKRTGNSFGSNKYDRKRFGVFTTTKSVGQSNLNNVKSDILEKSQTKATKRLKRKNSGKQTKDSKKPKITGTNSTKHICRLSEESEDPNIKLHSKLSNKPTKERKESFSSEESLAFLNNFDMNKDKINTKTNTKSKYYSNNKRPNKFLCSTPIRRSNKRNSSMIASRKIKAIEKMENAKNYENIDFQSSNSDLDSSIKIVEEIFMSNNVSKITPVKNEYESDKFWSTNSPGLVTTFDSFQSYSARKTRTENKTDRSNKKYKNTLEDSLDICNMMAESPLKEESDITKYFGTNLSDNQFAFKKEDKKKYNAANECIKNMLNIDKNATQNVPHKSNVESTVAYKGVVTRSKRKTWDMLEKELLGENDIIISDNESKTVILKEEKVVRKQNMKDADLYAVSNRSIKQTISKSPAENKYSMHMQYEIQNTESEFLEARTSSAHSYMNIFKNTMSKEIVPSNSRNVLVIERAITAMDKCTEEFNRQKVSFYYNLY